MAEHKKPADFQLYGRRKGPRLRARQAELVKALLPRLRIDPDDPDVAKPACLFTGAVSEVWLEIGFGGGEHLARQARHRPDVGIIGCEPFINGIAKLLTDVSDDNLENVRILDGDARDLLPALGPASLSRVFLLYPDPWPKRRHHKRRFINQITLDGIHRCLRPGGILRVSSDIPDYIRWTLFEVRRHCGFVWLAGEPGDWRNRPEDWPATRYEAKAIREGRTPTYLQFSRQDLPFR